MASEPKATKKVEFLNYVYTVKGIQCHSSYSQQLFELKITKTKTSHVV